MCLALLAASGPVGLLGGGVWLLAGLLVYGTSRLAPRASALHAMWLWRGSVARVDNSLCVSSMERG